MIPCRLQLLKGTHGANAVKVAPLRSRRALQCVAAKKPAPALYRAVFGPAGVATGIAGLVATWWLGAVVIDALKKAGRFSRASRTLKASVG